MKITNLISMLICLLLSIPTFVQSQWMQINGPLVQGLSINSICVKDSSVYVATNKGIYSSTNNGNSWLKIKVPDTAYAKQNQNIYSIATDGKNLYTVYGFIYRSSDDGNNWENIPYPSSAILPISEVVVTDSCILGYSFGGNNSIQSFDNGASWTNINSSITFAAFQDSIVLLQGYYGINISLDYGRTWTAIRQRGFNINYAIATSGSQILSGENNSIFYSTDMGLSWKPDSSVLNCRFITSIIFSPPGFSSNFIYAGTDSGVYRSSDNGASWELKNNGLIAYGVVSLAFKTIGTDGIPFLFAATHSGIFRSTDYGESWTPVGIPFSLVIAGSETDLFAGNAAGIAFKRADSKYEYEFMNNSRSTFIRTTDSGVIWSETDGEMENQEFLIKSFGMKNNKSEGDVVLGYGHWYQNNSLYIRGSVAYISNNNGASWTKVYSDSSLILNPFCAINTSGAFMNNGQGGILRSTDNCNSWTAIDSGFTVSLDQSTNLKPLINAISFNGDVIYAGGVVENITMIGPRQTALVVNNYVFKSTDNGTIWTRIAHQLPGKIIQYSNDTVQYLTCVYASGSHLIAGMKSYAGGSGYRGGGIYHFIANDDTSWILADSALFFKNIKAITGYKSDIFAATESNGMFRSTDYGTTWVEENTGLMDLNISALVVSGDYLFASTTSGLWKRPLSEITSVSDVSYVQYIPEKYSLSQNYPNPFNPTTTIKYEIPSSPFSQKGDRGGFITLKVYNLLGQEVATLFEGIRQPGSYETIFDGSGFSSGIYFYRLKSNNVVLTKKLVLLK